MNESRESTEANQRHWSSGIEHRRDGGSDDWWTSDRLGAAGWAAIFIWGAVVVLATYTDFNEDFSWWDGWGVFFLGTGVIVLAESGVRLFLPRYRSKLSWAFAWEMAFLSIGLGALFSSAWLALALIAVAVVILAGAFRSSNWRRWMGRRGRLATIGSIPPERGDNDGVLEDIHAPCLGGYLSNADVRGRVGRPIP
jgi:hypothetical protein